MVRRGQASQAEAPCRWQGVPRGSRPADWPGREKAAEDEDLPPGCKADQHLPVCRFDRCDGEATRAVGPEFGGKQADEEPEHEVGGLASVCGIEYTESDSDERDDEFELCAIDEVAGLRRVGIGVDSGAAASVWPRELCADYPTVRTDKTGMKYATAGKGSAHLVNEGERVVLLKMGDGSQRGARMQITNVRKPLVSVADMIDAGQDVHFMASGQSFAIHRESGVVTNFVRKKNIFEIEADVPSYKDAVAESSGF